ncbi:MAG: nucleotidyltransferase substrate binding protein [Spirochaeta sp.]|nr:nucleotidyltransferase substrate binding protein [Spirochaeta sp.]
MSDDIRWQQPLNSFRLSLATLDEVYERRQERELDRVELQALIKSFELSYETGWNLLKDWLEYQGFVDISGSRDAIRRAHSLELISDGDTWMQMLRTRNRTAHVYNEAVAREVEEYIVSRFYRTLHELAAEDIPGLALTTRQHSAGFSEISGYARYVCMGREQKEHIGMDPTSTSAS